jgi:folate-binding protein YgfZ
MTATRLAQRAVIRLSAADDSEDVTDFLEGLVTNTVKEALPVWAGLLTPQGKALFDFFVWPSGENLLIDCEAAAADALLKRLSLYRLRRKIGMALDPSVAVHWWGHRGDGAADDPRLAALGERWLTPRSDDTDEQGTADAAYLSHRLSLGVTEGQQELGVDATLWLECNAAELNGVSFEKGCYVGQENTARMNWRQKVNRRLVVVPLDQSDPGRRRAAYPELGLAVDHLRIEDVDAAWLPTWLTAPEER